MGLQTQQYVLQS